MGGALATALLGMALSATPIDTRPINIDALSGAWAFETEPHLDGCVIRGSAYATRNGMQLNIEMRAKQTCGDSDVDTDVTERCIGRDAGGVLAIRCTLLTTTSPNYVADNFFLVPASPQEMNGRLNDGSSWQNVGVRWQRPAPAAVS